MLILSGPVAAGKSTVARELVRLLTDDVVLIEGDVFWSFFVKGVRGPTQKSFRTIMSAMTAAAIPYATGGSQVILDFSIPPWFLDTVKKVAGVRDVPVDYVVLRPSEIRPAPSLQAVRRGLRPSLRSVGRGFLVLLAR